MIAVFYADRPTVWESHGEFKDAILPITSVLAWYAAFPDLEVQRALAEPPRARPESKEGVFPPRFPALVASVRRRERVSGGWKIVPTVLLRV
jgi:hypothetical protein